MAFLEKLKNLKIFGGDEKKKSKNLKFVTYHQDPLEVWEIVKELGDGAFGKVYMTRNKHSTMEAALKQVQIVDESDLNDCSVEINILSEIKHKNIVGLYETFLHNDKLWLFLEFCGGGAVDTIMLGLEKPLTEPQIKCVCRDACEGLDFLHQKYVIHRDVKAGNVLLTLDGQVKLADFGVSAKNDNSRKLRDTFIGTPYWMAPEVIHCETFKDAPYSYKADIWSLGITLIECAQIEPPNHDMHPMRVLMKIQKSDPPTLARPSSWSKDFNDFVSKCLVKDPVNRSTASELLQHSFIVDVKDNIPIRQLISEATAEVTEEVKEESDEISVGDSETNDSDSQTIPSPTEVILVDNLDIKEKLSEEIVTEIIEDVIMSNRHEPSIPSIVLASMLEYINNDLDDVPAPLEAIKLSEEDITRMADSILMEITDEVILSTTRQPSLAGIVLNVITELIKGVEESKTNGVANGAIENRRESTAGGGIAARRASRAGSVPVPGSGVVTMDTKGGAGDNSKKGFKRTLTRTRKYVNVDGQLVTTQTLSVVVVGEENKQQKNHEMRRIDMRELKLQQKWDNRQLTDLDTKSVAAFEEIVAKFEKDKQALMKAYELELEGMTRVLKQQVEKTQIGQTTKLRVLSKKLKMDEEKNIKAFKEAQKKELKSLSLTAEDKSKSMSKKELLKLKREEKIIEQTEKERKYVEQQTENSDKSLKSLENRHRQTIAQMEKQLLDQKQIALRAREGALWELEEHHLNDRHTILKRHLKDRFILQRQQMISRHDKEMEQMEESNEIYLSNLIQTQNLEKKRIPKTYKSESKNRFQTYKKHIRLPGLNLTPEQEREKLVQFEEQEKKRLKSQQDQLEWKHKQQITKCQTENQLRLRELEQIQKEKQKLLLTQETDKLKDLEDRFEVELNDWRQQLAEKKLKLEEDFRREVQEQEKFYMNSP